MSRTAENIALAAAAGVGVFLLLKFRKSDGTTVEVGEVEEVTVTAQRLPLPASKGPPQRLGPWKIPAEGERFRPHFEAAETRHGVPALLLARQAYQESRFRRDIIEGRVRSSAGAIGLMQIIPRWHPSIDPGDAAADERAALDPARAIDYAAKYMRQLFDRFGSWSLALAAYNWGPTNLARHRARPDAWPAETRAYVEQITNEVGIA